MRLLRSLDRKMNETKRVANIFTVDVEDYFQVETFSSIIPRTEWKKFKLRVHKNLERLFQLLDNYNIKATFFVLGWLAEKDPEIVSSIYKAGHEIASHGFSHLMISKQTREEFRDDVGRSKKILEDIISEDVIGYRAPTYSIMKSTLWALEILQEEGYKYDSSIYPIVHDRYGIPGAKREIHKIELNKNKEIIEIPLSTLKLLLWNIPLGSGGYLRIFPLCYTIWGMNFLNSRGNPVIINIHPWEVDPEQPPLPVKRFSKFRHYKNIDKTLHRLEMILERFEFQPARKVIEEYK